ncbi:MAG: insulinase family protein [Clostridiales bacterium]|nr:insulinase family protein [Clostridiales bacterium]
MAQMKEYKNGLRLCVETVPSVRSVSVGFWVGVGSKYENVSNNGISHYIEHMMFKGTDNLNPFQIASKFEDMGAIINAFTSKEATCYYFKVVDKYVRESFSLLSDIFFHSAFTEEEMEKEKNVVIEEINMGEDEPEEICSDLISEAIYGKNSLGQTIIGNKENVKKFTKNDIKTHISKYYVSHNTVISMAGNITFEDAEKLVEEYVLENYSKEYVNFEKPVNMFCESSYSYRFKDFEQSNIAIAFPGASVLNPISANQAVLSILLGGGMSSRLFQNIRENKGLAYSVYSSPSAYFDSGYFGIYINNSLENSEKVVKATREEIDLLLSKGVTKEEIDRSKVQLISSLVFSQENIQSVMLSQGKWLLSKAHTDPYNINARINEIEKCTVDSVIDFAKLTFDLDKSYCAYVGKEINVDLHNVLKN